MFQNIFFIIEAATKLTWNTFCLLLPAQKLIKHAARVASTGVDISDHLQRAVHGTGVDISSHFHLAPTAN